MFIPCLSFAIATLVLYSILFIQQKFKTRLITNATQTIIIETKHINQNIRVITPSKNLLYRPLK